MVLEAFKEVALLALGDAMLLYLGDGVGTESVLSETVWNSSMSTYVKLQSCRGHLNSPSVLVNM